MCIALNYLIWQLFCGRLFLYKEMTMHPNCQDMFLMSRAWSDAKITWQRLVTRDASVTPCHENCHNFDTTLTQAMVTCHWWRIEPQIASDSFVNLCIGCIDVIIVLFIWDLTKDAEMHPKTCHLSSRWTKKTSVNRTNNVMRSEGGSGADGAELQ